MALGSALQHSWASKKQGYSWQRKQAGQERTSASRSAGRAVQLHGEGTNRSWEDIWGDELQSSPKQSSCVSCLGAIPTPPTLLLWSHTKHLAEQVVFGDYLAPLSHPWLWAGRELFVLVPTPTMEVL